MYIRQGEDIKPIDNQHSSVLNDKGQKGDELGTFIIQRNRF